MSEYEMDLFEFASSNSALQQESPTEVQPAVSPAEVQPLSRNHFPAQVVRLCLGCVGFHKGRGAEISVRGFPAFGVDIARLYDIFFGYGNDYHFYPAF